MKCKVCGNTSVFHSLLRRSVALKRAGCSTLWVVCALPTVRRLRDAKDHQELGVLCGVLPAKCCGEAAGARRNLPTLRGH